MPGTSLRGSSQNKKRGRHSFGKVVGFVAGLRNVGGGGRGHWQLAPAQEGTSGKTGWFLEASTPEARAKHPRIAANLYFSDVVNLPCPIHRAIIKA